MASSRNNQTRNTDIEALLHLHPQAKLTTRQAACYLGVPIPTLHFWRTGGECGPSYLQLGAKCIRYRKADLDAYLDAAAGGPGQVPSTL